MDYKFLSAKQAREQATTLINSDISNLLKKISDNIDKDSRNGYVSSSINFVDNKYVEVIIKELNKLGYIATYVSDQMDRSYISISW